MMAMRRQSGTFEKASSLLWERGIARTSTAEEAPHAVRVTEKETIEWSEEPKHSQTETFVTWVVTVLEKTRSRIDLD